MDRKGTHIYTCIHSPLNCTPSQAATWHWAEFPVLSSRSLLVLHVKYSSVSMSIPDSLTITPPSFPLGTIRLLQSIEQSSLCWPAGPCWLSLLNTAVRNTFFKKFSKEFLHWIRRRDSLLLGSISGKVRQLELIPRRKKLALIRVS